MTRKKGPTLADLERFPNQYAKEREELHHQLAAMPRFVSPLEELPPEYVDAISKWPDRALDSLTPGDAAEIVRSVKATQRSRGGKAAGHAGTVASAAWHLDCKNAALQLLQQDRALHELCGILSVRFEKSAAQVRTVLQTTGVLPPKKKRK